MWPILEGSLTLQTVPWAPTRNDPCVQSTESALSTAECGPETRNNSLCPCLTLSTYRGHDSPPWTANPNGTLVGTQGSPPNTPRNPSSPASHRIRHRTTGLSHTCPKRLPVAEIYSHEAAPGRLFQRQNLSTRSMPTCQGVLQAHPGGWALHHLPGIRAAPVWARGPARPTNATNGPASIFMGGSSGHKTNAVKGHVPASAALREKKKSLFTRGKNDPSEHRSGPPPARAPGENSVVAPL